MRLWIRFSTRQWQIGKMDKSVFFSFIEDNGKLDEKSLSGLEKLVEEYPYFQTAHLLLAKNRYLTRRKEFEKNLAKTAAFCADRSRFFYLINSDKYARFFPKKTASDPVDRTQALLDSYLDAFSEKPREIPEIETSIISTDYFTYLQSLEKEPGGEIADACRNEFKHQDVIDSFLEKAEANEITITSLRKEPDKPQEKGAEPDNDGFLTETLAQIYIKQKKYEQALTIIRQLSLNFPKKNVYFADQIRFLELLILIEKNKKE